jgi:D-alanyl-D-alanine carboxypeptidase
MEYIVVNQSDLLARTQEEQTRVYSQDGIYHDAVNTNYYIDEIPGIIGSKTGYTDLAGGNLVVAFDAGLNRPIIISVLGSTRQERFTDVMKLVAEVQHYVTKK